MSDKKLYPPLIWTLVYDREQLKKLDRGRYPGLWDEQAKQLAEQEVEYAIKRGEFLANNNLIEAWKEGLIDGN